MCRCIVIDLNSLPEHVDEIPPKTRSQHRKAHLEQRRNIALAVSDLVPNCFVSIEAIWIDAEVLDKRKSTEGHYEYLVRPQWMSSMCAVWKHPKDISKTHLVQQFEEARMKQVPDKSHLATWYPFREDLVIRWKDTPFFIVSYGSGQFNNFCIVGLDKTNTVLKCKKAHHPHQTQHQIHVQMVAKELTKLNLKIHNRNFYPVDQIHSSSATANEIPKPVNKPLSQQPIKLITTDKLYYFRQHQSSATVPIAFVPPSTPQFCKCVTDIPTAYGEPNLVCQTKYKLAPEPYSKATYLWLPSGPPITDRRAFLWRCQKHNPECTIYYDGNTDAIFNYSNSTMVSHAVLFGFLFSMATGYGCMLLERMYF